MKYTNKLNALKSDKRKMKQIKIMGEELKKIQEQIDSLEVQLSLISLYKIDLKIED